MIVERMFAELITDDVRSLVRGRLVHGGNMATRKDMPRATIKLVLLLVRECNALEAFSKEELSIMMGVSRQTLSKTEREKKMVHVINH